VVLGGSLAGCTRDAGNEEGGEESAIEGVESVVWGGNRTEEGVGERFVCYYDGSV